MKNELMDLVRREGSIHEDVTKGGMDGRGDEWEGGGEGPEHVSAGWISNQVS